MKISETEIALEKLKLKISKDKTQKLNLEGSACEKKNCLLFFQGIGFQFAESVSSRSQLPPIPGPKDLMSFSGHHGNMHMCI